MSTQLRILLGRFLTLFGDQAWDFAVPLVLIELFPGKIQLISVLYLLSKIIHIFLGPNLQRKIDYRDRLSIFKMGIGLQVVSMLLIWSLVLFYFKINQFGSPLFLFLILGLLTATSSLGSSLMSTSVGYDLALDMLHENELTQFNTKLTRLDLFTEVSAPIFTGLVLAYFSKKNIFIGLSLVALLNVLTFLPEYFLLSTIPNVNTKFLDPNSSAETELGILKSLRLAYTELKGRPYTPVILSYAFLWLSILSPHGVLLTTYLKDGPHLSEFSIGLFRGLGALFGLIPTFLYPRLKQKMGILRASQHLVFFQFICVLFAGISFYFLNDNMAFFLVFILFSRIGLYGYSIGETELRQGQIPREKRGFINGIANSLTSMATLILFILGSIFGSIQTFGILVGISIIAVFLGVIESRKISVSL